MTDPFLFFGETKTVQKGSLQKTGAKKGPSHIITCETSLRRPSMTDSVSERPLGGTVVSNLGVSFRFLISLFSLFFVKSGVSTMMGRSV